MTNINEQFLNGNASSKVSSTATLYTIRNYGTFMPVTHEYMIDNLEKTLGLETQFHYTAKVLLSKKDETTYFINVVKKDDRLSGEVTCWLDRDTDSYKIEGYHLEEDTESPIAEIHSESEDVIETEERPTRSITIERKDCAVNPKSNTIENVLKYLTSLLG